jgi:hypothetical protein
MVSKKIRAMENIDKIGLFKVTSSDENKDAVFSKKQYLDMLHDFVSLIPDPVVERHSIFNVVRDDLLGYGTKARAGEFLVQNCKQDTIVYVQPRFGFAGISLINLCNKYGKKLVLFMPASKEASKHQAYCIEHGCHPIFVRIAAMPVLNQIAEKYAARNDAMFIPLGLHHKLAIAALIKIADKIAYPKQFWTACSTMVLNRSLQIAWPRSEAMGVAVARNIQPGERGRCKVFSHYLQFARDCHIDRLPPFPSARNYDAKVWEFMNLYAAPDALFWNVASDISISINPSSINSNASWAKKKEQTQVELF